MNKEEYKKRLIGTFPSLYGFIVGCFDEDNLDKLEEMILNLNKAPLNKDNKNYEN